MKSINPDSKRAQKTIITASQLYLKGFKDYKQDSQFLINDQTLFRKIQNKQENKEVDENYEYQQKHLISRSTSKEQFFTNPKDIKFFFYDTINRIELPSMMNDVYFTETKEQEKDYPSEKYKIKSDIKEDKEIENSKKTIDYKTLFLNHKKQTEIGILYDCIQNNTQVRLFQDIEKNNLYVQKQIKIELNNKSESIEVINQRICREVDILKQLTSSKTNITLKFLDFKQFNDDKYQYFNLHIQSGIKNLNDIKQQYQITESYDEYAIFLEYSFFKLLEKLNSLHFIEQIAHSDIKPSNIVLGYDLELYIIDFGASILLNNQSDYQNYLVYITHKFNFTKNIEKKSNWKREEIINCDTSQLILSFLFLMCVKKSEESYKQLLEENKSEEFLKNLLDPFKKLGKYLCECLNQLYQDSNVKYVLPQTFIFSNQFHNIEETLKKLQDLIYDKYHNRYYICCINDSSKQIIEVLANNHNGNLKPYQNQKNDKELTNFESNYLNKILEITYFDAMLLIAEYNLFQKECSIAKCLRIIELAPAKILCLDYLNKDDQINSRFIQFDDKLGYLLIKSYEYQNELLDILVQNGFQQIFQNTNLKYVVILSDNKNKIKSIQDLEFNAINKKFLHLILTEKVKQKFYIVKHLYTFEIKNKEILDYYINTLIMLSILSFFSSSIDNEVPQPPQKELIYLVDKEFIKIIFEKYILFEPEEGLLKRAFNGQHQIVEIKQRIVEFNLRQQYQIKNLNFLKINKFSDQNRGQHEIYTAQFLDTPQRQEKLDLMKKKGVILYADSNISLSQEDGNYFQDKISSQNQINGLFQAYCQQKKFYFNFEDFFYSFTLIQQLKFFNKIYENSRSKFQFIELKFPENKEINNKVLIQLIDFINNASEQIQIKLHFDKVIFAQSLTFPKRQHFKSDIQNIQTSFKQAQFENSEQIFQLIQLFYKFNNNQFYRLYKQNMNLDFSDSQIQNNSQISNQISFKNHFWYGVSLEFKLCFDNINFGDNNKLEIILDKTIPLIYLIITTYNSNLKIKLTCEDIYLRILNWYIFFAFQDKKWYLYQIFYYIIEFISMQILMILAIQIRLFNEKYYELFEELPLLFAFQYLLILFVQIIRNYKDFKRNQSYEKILKTLRALIVLFIFINQFLIFYSIASSRSYHKFHMGYWQQIFWDQIYYSLIMINFKSKLFKIYKVSIKQDQTIMKQVQVNEIFTVQILSIIFVFAFYFIFYIIFKIEY